jgi:hypothetical protein
MIQRIAPLGFFLPIVSVAAFPTIATASDALTIDIIRAAEKHTNAGFEALENYFFWSGRSTMSNANRYAEIVCAELRAAEFMLDTARVSMTVGGPNEIDEDSEIYLHAMSQTDDLAMRFPCPEQNSEHEQSDHESVQQIRGSCSPLNMVRVRKDPQGERSTTEPTCG